MSDYCKTVVTNLLDDYTTDQIKIAKYSRVILDYLSLDDFDLSVVFCSSDFIKKLNIKFRDKDSSTDVLSFSQVNNFKKDIAYKILGDIVISLDDANKSAIKLEHSLEKEACFLLVHGVLHLYGHDHNCKKKEILMIEQQKKILSILNNNGNPFWLNTIKMDFTDYV